MVYLTYFLWCEELL